MKNIPTMKNNEDWGTGTPHNLTHLREVLNRYTEGVNELAEISMGGTQPALMKHTEVDDVIIQVSAAYKSNTAKSIERQSAFVRTESKKEKIKELFSEVESPAITTREVADRMKCTEREVFEKLIELEHRGWINKRQSGDTTLWWPQEDDEENDRSDILPDYVQNGLEKSKQDVRQWVEENKRDGESIEEAHERIRGNPDPSEIKELLGGSESDDNDFVEKIKQKRNNSEDRKEKLQNLF